jgi:hypothetical protein
VKANGAASQEAMSATRLETKKRRVQSSNKLISFVPIAGFEPAAYWLQIM